MKNLTIWMGIFCSLIYGSKLYGQNIALGAGALINNTTGYSNVAIGDDALHQNTTGYMNTSLGFLTLTNNTTGNRNTAVGFHTLTNNVNGLRNTVMGYNAMHNNISGSHNTATGIWALHDNISGSHNTASGNSALTRNLEGDFNSAFGTGSLAMNTIGNSNTAIGLESLHDNSTGNFNTASGASSLSKNKSGSQNTAMGYNALHNNESGHGNTALGGYALHGHTNGMFNTVVGFNAFTTGSYDNSIVIGVTAQATASFQARIGNTSITSIGGFQNWTNLSDGRFKKAVEEDVIGLAFINALRPVSYYVDNEAINEFLGVELDDQMKDLLNDQAKTYQTGFIAQEVEATVEELGFKHFHGVDAPKNENDHYGLRYAEFVVPLVKSVQELSAQNEDQMETIEELKDIVNKQQLQIEALLTNSANKSTTSNINTTSSRTAKLYQNIPNPYKGSTQIKVFIPTDAQQAFLQVTDLTGKQLFVETIDAFGEQTLTLFTSELEVGMYLYTLVVDQEIVATKKMVVAE